MLKEKDLRKKVHFIGGELWICNHLSHFILKINKN